MIDPRVKICGLTRPADVEQAVRAGADAVGFVMVRSSSRFVTPKDVASLLGHLPPFVTPVAVVDLTDPLDREAATELDRAVAAGVRCVQFHGHEAPWDLQRWKAALGGPVIKAIRLATRADLATMASYEAIVDAFLLDGGAGEGRRCDWELAAKAVESTARPVILAGGLTPANVGEAVARIRPYAVDVSSGVEISPGHKDGSKIGAFIRAAKPSCGLHGQEAGV